MFDESKVPMCSIHGKFCQGHPTPTPERVKDIIERCYFDADGNFGRRGTMYVDGRPISEPTELVERKPK